VSELARTDTPTGINRLSPAQVAHIVQLKHINPNVTQQQLADAVGTTQGTVSRWLAAFEHSTRESALKHYESNQLEIAATVVDIALHSENERAKLQAAELAHRAVGVGQKADASVGNVAIQVVIGMPGAPAGPDPFDVVDSKGPTAPTVLDA
jgi:hypothetical protein